MVRQVAAEEGCSVLPTFECMVHRTREFKRARPLRWTPLTFNSRMAGTIMKQEDHKQKNNGTMIPWEEIGPEKDRPLFASDLVHFNEYGGALHAALVQEW